MEECLKQSIEYANQKNYLDRLFQVYPTIPNGIRNINHDIWNKIEKAFDKRDNSGLINLLLSLELFPLKDSYVAYLRRDKKARERNPETINRLAGMVYEIGINSLYEKCSEPKETNRQMGQLFKNWIKKGVLGVPLLELKQFEETKGNAVLDTSDEAMKEWAKKTVNYKREKGLDFVARFNGKFIIGEAKFLTDFGGHQNAQFNDAILTLTEKDVNAVQIAILDGVLYIPSKNKMFTAITKTYCDKYIMSALVMREFLYSL